MTKAAPLALACLIVLVIAASLSERGEGRQQHQAVMDSKEAKFVTAAATDATDDCVFKKDCDKVCGPKCNLGCENGSCVCSC
ncbi:unnamed protein product [Prunus armeniaca]|uniref:Uncharacterized protein n=1 Tax=Prunus armeniaca TaxID=36596 RepID=A0A6J5WGQ8_PRUAR|nr:unnamed protein product [Prunus armeniaca]CAB4298534.1 unnamed protein product [Prunus armeniaca]